jgi:hypothetical protein
METRKSNLTEAQIKAKSRARMIDGARKYALADRTNPFAFRQMMTHIDNGVASVHRGLNKDYELAAGPAFYSAETLREARKIIGSDGQEQIYDIMTFRNVVRP